MRSTVLCVLVLASPLLAQATKEKEIPASLEGHWRITWGSEAGLAVGDGVLYWTVDSKNRVQLSYGPIPEKGGTTFDLTLDPKKKHMDRKEGEKIYLGLYDFKDGELVVCFNIKGKDRPFGIESRSTYGFHVYTLKKVAPPEKKAEKK